MDYQPKVILTEHEHDEYLTELYKNVKSICNNLDPPNPFNNSLTSGDNIQIVLNDTNDLRHCIKKYERKILDGYAEHVIIGDPNAFGYGENLINEMIKDVSLPIEFTRNSKWIIVKINIVGKELIIKNTRIWVK